MKETRKLHNKQPVPLNPLEEYVLHHDPNLSDKNIKDMVALRKKENPDFVEIDPMEWNLRPEGASYALISMLIKEDLEQTAAQLAEALMSEKKVSFTSAAFVVNKLRKTKHLFFYTPDFNGDYIIHLWHPKVVIKPCIA